MSGINKRQVQQVQYYMDCGKTLEEALALLCEPDNGNEDEARAHFENMDKAELVAYMLQVDRENQDQEVYRTFVSNDQDAILEDLRDQIAQNAGVTLTGNRLTIRWSRGGKLVQVHCVILQVG